jgi:hypothetical protein
MGQNLLAYSGVMALIYLQASINLWFPDWPYKDVSRVILGLSAIIVVWWRLILLLNEISAWRKRRKKNVHQEVLERDDRASDQDDGAEPAGSLGDR